MSAQNIDLNCFTYIVRMQSQVQQQQWTLLNIHFVPFCMFFVFFYVNSLKILQITCFFGSGYESVHNWGRKQYYNTIANFKFCRMKSSFLTPNTPLVDWTAITLIFYAAEIKFWSRGSNYYMNVCQYVWRDRFNEIRKNMTI